MSKRGAVTVLECAVLAAIAVWIFTGPTVSRIFHRFGWSILFLVFFSALIVYLRRGL